MQVAQLQNPKTIELRRKVLEGKIEALKPDILCIADAAIVEAADSQQYAEQG